MTATERLEIRVSPIAKARLSYAAELVSEPVSAFVRSAVEDRIAEVIAQHEAVTVLPGDVFDELMDWLDNAPPEPNEPMRRAAARARARAREA